MVCTRVDTSLDSEGIIAFCGWVGRISIVSKEILVELWKVLPSSKLTWLNDANGKSPLLKEDTSPNACFSMIMLVLLGVCNHKKNI